MTTVEGAFKILDRASPALERIDRKANALDRTLEKVGKRMDDFSAKTEKDMRVAEGGVNHFARTTEKSATKVTASMEGMQRGISSAVHQSQRDLAGLQTQMAATDAQNVSPDVDIDTSAAMAQLKALGLEIDRINAKSVNVGASASGTKSAPISTGRKPGIFKQVAGAFLQGVVGQAQTEGAGWAARKVDKWRNRNNIKDAEQEAAAVSHVEREYYKLSNTVGRSRGVFGSAGERIASWTKIILAAGPVVEALAGAASGLIGSLGGATLGGAAGLTGLIGTAAVGMGGFLGVLIPTIGKIKEAKTAQDAYNKTVQKYGKNSEEAVKAQHLYERTGTPGARKLLGAWSGTSKWWQRKTGRGQEATLGLMTDLISRGKAKFGNQAANIANNSGVAIRAGGNEMLNTLDSPNVHRNLNILSNTFDSLTPDVGRILGNLGGVFTNIAAAAKPQVVEFIKWLDKWMQGANKDTSGLDKVQKYFKEWTTDLKTWVNFIKQAGQLLGAFFGRGQKSGNALTNEASHQMREWRELIEANPKGVENWIGGQTDNFKKLFREMGALLGGLGEMVDALSNLIAPITEINQFVRTFFGGGATGLIATAALTAGSVKGGKAIGKWGVGKLGKLLGSEYLMGKGGIGVRGSTKLNPLWVRMVSGIGPGGPGGTPPVVAPGESKGGKFRSAAGKFAKGAAGLFGGVLAAETGLDILRGTGIIHGDPTEGRGVLGNATNNSFVTNPEQEKHALSNIQILEKKRKLAPNNLLGAIPSSIPGMPNLLKKSAEDAGQEWNNELGRSIEAGSGQVQAAAESGVVAVQKGIKGPLAKMLSETGDAYGKMRQQAIGQLVSMGYSHSSATAIVSGLNSGSKGAKEAVGMGPGMSQIKGHLDPHFTRGGGKQHGGMIGGTGMQDTVRFGDSAVAPGEYAISTRHHQATINRLLPPGVSLRNIIEGDKRGHSSPMRRRAGGGMASVASFATGMGLHAGEGPGEATPGIHVPDSLHYQGLAYDVSGAPNLMMQFRKAAEQKYLGHGLNELFYDPYSYYIDSGNKVPGSIGGHSDHVHIGFFPGGPSGAGKVKAAMAMAGAGAHFKKVQHAKSKQGGVPGAMAMAAMDAFATGLNKKLGAKAGMKANAAGSLGAGYIKGGGGPVAMQIMRILMAAGLSKAGAAGITGNALQESGWNPGSVGSGGGGLWGFTASPNSLADLQAFAAQAGKPWTDVALQTQFMLQHVPASVIAQLNAAGSPGAAAGIFMNEWERPYAPTANLARREEGANQAFGGWHKRGGSFRVDRPTLFGVGDGPGSEQVTISGSGSQAKKGGHKGGPLVHIEKIEYHGKGDIKKAVEEEFAAIGMSLDAFVDDEDELL